MLDCVDGVLDEQELCFVSGVSVEQVEQALDRMVELGLVDFGAVEEAAPEQAAAEAADADGDGIQLDADARARIDDLYEVVSGADYYEMLGLPREADTNAIKKAYYKVGPKFHPDKFFGKELGPYKQKIETIFTALTKAHDTLRYRGRREAYDNDLPPLRVGDRIRHAARHDSSEPAPPAAGEAQQEAQQEAQREAQREAKGPEPAASSSAPPERAREAVAPVVSLEDAPIGPREARQRDEERGAAPVAQPVRRRRKKIVSRTAKAELSPKEIKAARDAVARKLKRGASPVTRQSAGRRSAAPARARKPAAPRTEARVVQRAEGTFKAAEEVDRSAAEVLRDRFQQVGAAAKERRLQRYLSTARDAMNTGDYRAAVAAYEQATKLSPDDAELQEQFEQAQQMALNS